MMMMRRKDVRIGLVHKRENHSRDENNNKNIHVEGFNGLKNTTLKGEISSLGVQQILSLLVSTGQLLLFFLLVKIL